MEAGSGRAPGLRTCPYCGGLVAVTPAHKQLRRHLSSGEFCRGSGLGAEALSVQNAQPEPRPS